MKESVVENFLCTGIAERGGWAAKMIDKGRRGAPDRECRFKGALTIYVETKTIGGHLNSWQKRYHMDLAALGYMVLTLWTIDDVSKFFSDFDRGMYGIGVTKSFTAETACKHTSVAQEASGDFYCLGCNQALPGYKAKMESQS